MCNIYSNTFNGTCGTGNISHTIPQRHRKYCTITPCVSTTSESAFHCQTFGILCYQCCMLLSDCDPRADQKPPLVSVQYAYNIEKGLVKRSFLTFLLKSMKPITIICITVRILFKIRCHHPCVRHAHSCVMHMSIQH